jgi:hypothetical protein
VCFELVRPNVVFIDRSSAGVHVAAVDAVVAQAATIVRRRGAADWLTGKHFLGHSLITIGEAAP